MTDYRNQPINQKNADFVEQVVDRIEEMQLEGRSLWQDAKRRFFRNKAAVASLIILAFIIVFITVAPWFFPFTYEDTDWNMMSSPPTMEGYHFFGTDASGRDLLVRTAIGGRISLLVGIAGAFISVTIGTIYGAISGYVGGKTDMLMMRFLEILSSFPFMLFVILLVTLFGQNIFLIFIAIGAIAWLGLARIVRGQTLSLKNKEFVEAAIVCGVPRRQIIFKHIIPNVLGLVAVYASLEVPGLFLFESFLSFLGLGTQEPMSSWGALLSDGAAQMEVSPWLLIFPAFFLCLTLFCFNFIGDGLRDALDPKDR